MEKIKPSQLSLRDVEEKLKLQSVWNDPSFFLEWQLDGSEITDFERNCPVFFIGEIGMARQKMRSCLNFR